MGDFTLDTSGEVTFPAIIAMTGEPDSIALSYRWRHLDAFTQGYVEALFETLDERNFIERLGEHGDPDYGFSDLSPEALAAILKDCARAKPMEGYRADEYAKMGRQFWMNRQSGLLPERFQPLTVTLSDDGKVYLAEAAQ